jgi:L-cystine uptake protein TcyP (sodium:dicarboxylate symporter family)
MAVIFNIIVFLACIALFIWMQRKRWSFNKRVLIALGVGIVLGTIFQLVYTASPDVIKNTNAWINMVGNGYVRLLRMCVIPLIFVSIIGAIINQKGNLGKATAAILIVLLLTTAISAVVGIGVSKSLGLTAHGLQIGESEQQATQRLEDESSGMSSVQSTLTNIIPSNAFYSMTGQGSSATLSVVVFAALLGLALMGVRKKKPTEADFFTNMINSLQAVVLRLVTMILRLTPYGIFALMTATVASTDFASVARLAVFIVASYVAIILMFIIHGVIVAVFGFSPLTFFKKAATTLTFAFTSRTSAGTLPMTISTLNQSMGVSEGVANLAPSLGIAIGQNGCAGIYPAMLAIMVAPTVGVQTNFLFLLSLVAVVTISSIGIAGVGGGATFAGITVLSIMGLPVGIAGVLIAIEPLIDMGRTALNVSDAMVSALVSDKLLGGVNMEKYKSTDTPIVEFTG